MSKPIILFEGLDGAGKTYALNHLKEYYEKQGEKVHVVDSIPYQTFLDSHDKAWFDLTNTNTRYFEYMAWQVNNFYKNIKPYVGEAVILIDRFLPSCFAYNAVSVDPYAFLFLKVMDQLLKEFFAPSITFLFDVPNLVLSERHKQTAQPEKMTNFDFINTVRSEYERFVNIYGDKYNVHRMAGDVPIERTLVQMLEAIEG